MASDADKRAQAQHLNNAVAKLSAPEKAAYAAAVIASQQSRKELSYYSTVRFQFALTGTGPYVYTLKASNKVVAFTYGQGDTNLTAAGFPAAFGAASWAETNLLAGGDISGKTVDISGISLYLSELSDAQLAKLVWSTVYADISINGVDRYMLLGRLGRIPGGGGLDGSNGKSALTEPPLGQAYAGVGNVNNGQPHATNFFRLPEKIRWNPAGKQDSKFQIRFVNDRALSISMAADRAAATGVAAWAHPVDGADGTYVDVVSYLKAVEIIDRSLQA